MRTETLTKRLELLGDYKIKGQIILPINGEGKANITMYDVTSTQDFKGEYYTKPDGETYLNVTEYKIKFKPKKATFYFDNLFNGDKELGRTMNQFLNQNWKAVFAGLMPEYEKFFASKFKEVSNSFFDKVPLNRIFLD